MIKEAGAIRFLGPLENVDELAQHLRAFLVPQTVGIRTGRRSSVMAEGMGIVIHAHALDDRGHRLAVRNHRSLLRLQSQSDQFVSEKNLGLARRGDARMDLDRIQSIPPILSIRG